MAPDSDTWVELDPFDTIGGIGGGLPDDVVEGQLGSASIQSLPSIAHPDHPFFWFAAIAAVTVGLVGASTHLRVGPFRAGVTAGKD